MIQGQLDVPLDETGREQARAAAEVLKAVAPYAIVSSDLVRARDTAQELAAITGSPVTFDERLRELYLGAWQGLTAEQARQQFPSEHAAWRDGRDLPRGGGETYAAAGLRAAACLTSLPLPAGETLVAVTHGGTARATLATLLELSSEQAWRLAALGNCCWSVLVEAERGWRLERHNTGLGPLVGKPDGAVGLGSSSGPLTL